MVDICRPRDRHYYLPGHSISRIILIMFVERSMGIFGHRQSSLTTVKAYRMADHVLECNIRPNRLIARTGKSSFGTSTTRRRARISKASSIFPCCSSAVIKLRRALDRYTVSSSQACLDHDSSVSQLPYSQRDMDILSSSRASASLCRRIASRYATSASASCPR